MAKINVLDSSIFNLISAGEVVERPASVVKELVENSIDAGATSIAVEIKEGGISSISVTDDGSGIDKENMRLAFLPHATSKLSKAEDLDNIATLGFRGEALASVAAVAQVTMTSKTCQEDVGNYIVLHAGKIIDEGKKAIAQSTSIVVDNLFFNTPVRKKFLKKPKQEEATVTQVMMQLALANPDIKFKYVVDCKTVFQTNGGLEEAIYSIYPNDLANGLIPFDYTFDNYRVYGYTGTPAVSKHNRNYQTIIINGRIITNATISTAVAQAYGNRLMTRTFPVFVLNIIMPFDQVDVNVHPTKTDVRFEDTHKVFSCVYKAISSALAENEHNIAFGKAAQSDKSNNNGIASEAQNSQIINSEVDKSKTVAVDNKEENISLSKKSEKTENSSIFDKLFEEKENTDYDKLIEKQRKVIEEMKYEKDLPKSKFATVEDGLKILPIAPEQKQIPKNGDMKYDFSKDGKEKVQSSLLEMIDSQLETSYRVIGQIFDTYLIVESDGIVYFIDQHACHERYIYDTLLEQVNAKSVDTQYMLIPYIVECNNNQYEFMLQMSDNLRQLGFDIEEFGDLSFKINSVPYVLRDINLGVFFANLFEERQSVQALKNSDIIKDKLAQKACKSAIKAGAKLDDKQIRQLLDSMKGGIPLQCPHGRPAVLKYTRKDFDKLFKRIV